MLLLSHWNLNQILDLRKHLTSCRPFKIAILFHQLLSKLWQLLPSLVAESVANLSFEATSGTVVDHFNVGSHEFLSGIIILTSP